MCGIVGIIALGTLNKNDEEKRQRFMRFASTELLLRTDERGKDATGASILFADGNYAGIKRGEEATKWLAKFGNSQDYYGSLLKIWEEYDHPVKIFLGHCRKGTVGDKEDNGNNHPIKIGNIIGVHNGVINNDKEILEHLGCKRDGKVDSEMIFRLMHYLTNEGREPFTMPMLENLIARLTGAWAVMAFNADNLHQMPIFRDSRPIEFVLIKELSVLVVLSEIKFWGNFHFQYERTIFYARNKTLPSLLNMDIEKKTMPDDSALIIDLDYHCTKDTKIDDIWTWQKIRRDNKIWTSHIALNKKSSVGVSSVSSGQSMAKVETSTTTAIVVADTKALETESEEDTVNKDKRRIFDSITKKYIVRKSNHPKKLKDSDSATISLTTDKDEVYSNVPEENKEEEVKTKSTFVDDVEDQEASEQIIVEDYTDYEDHMHVNSESNDLVKMENGSEDAATDVIVPEVIDKEALTEVDMSVDNVELMALATKAYDALPIEEKGYSDMDPLLTDIDIKDEDMANQLGIKLVSNRVACIQWVRGFIHGWKKRDKDLKPEEAKTKLREKHISGLKSLVVILASYFSKSKETKNAPIVLAEVAMDHLSKRPSFDMKNISGVFNAHEEDKIKDVEEIISVVAESVE